MAALALLTAFVPMLISAFVSSRVCPQNWFQHGQFCYYATDVGMAWADAVNLCRNLGGSLAVIESAEENAFVTAVIRSLDMTSSGVWLACNDIEEEGRWVCLSEGNSTKPMEFRNWPEGQPNNYNGQDCTKLSVNGGLWYDNDCVTDRFAALCERLAIPRATEGPRGVTIKKSGMKCYTMDFTGR